MKKQRKNTFYSSYACICGIFFVSLQPNLCFVMKLSVKNIGCIKKGEISLNGLTVIAGENGSGKSTLSKMLFSVIKAVASIAQETDTSANVLLEKYATALYQRLPNARQLPLAQMQERYRVLPSLPKHFVSKLLTLKGTEELDKYIIELESYIESQGELSLRVKKLAKKDIDSIKALLYKENQARQLWSEIRYFVESEFMNQITTVGENSSNVAFYWDEKKKEGVEFSIRNEEMNMVGCTIKNVLEDATYIESPLYLPLMDPLRRASTYVENIKSSILQPMVPLHVKDIVNKYDLLSNYMIVNDNEEVLYNTISEIIEGKFVYDEQKRLIYFQNKEGYDLMPINVASGVKAFGVLQVLLHIGAIDINKPLLWDEPENHLHPAWQVKFAEMLVQLCKSGIPIVISTHSPYFIQSIRYYAAKHDVEKAVNYYMAEKGDDGLAKIKEVTNDLGVVFAKLSAPLSEVLNIPNAE